MEALSRGGGGGGPGFGGMDGMDPADIFTELFGASMGFGFDFGPSRGPRRRKGQDSNIPYEVSLEDLYNGKTVKMNMEKEVVCGTCKGYVLLTYGMMVTLLRCINNLQYWCQRQRKAKTLREVRGKGMDECHHIGEYNALLPACRDQCLQLGPSRLGTHRAMCTECEGVGEKLREKDRCAMTYFEATIVDVTPNHL